PGGRAGRIASVRSLCPRAGRVLAAYPELAAVLVAAVAGLSARRPFGWLTVHQGINALLVILVLATAVTIDPDALRRLARAWRHLAVAVLGGRAAGAGRPAARRRPGDRPGPVRDSLGRHHRPRGRRGRRRGRRADRL